MVAKNALIYGIHITIPDPSRHPTSSQRVFDVANGNACVGVCRDFTRAVFSTDWSPTEDKLAVAGGDASIKFINVVEKGEMDEAAVSDENLRSGVGNLNINNK